MIKLRNKAKWGRVIKYLKSPASFKDSQGNIERFASNTVILVNRSHNTRTLNKKRLFRYVR